MTNTQKCREAANEINRVAADFDALLTTEKVAKIIKRYFPEPAKVDGDKARLDWLERKTPLAIWMGTFSDNDYNISLGRAGAPICTISSMDCDGSDVDEEICRGDSIRSAIDAIMNKSQ